MPGSPAHAHRLGEKSFDFKFVVVAYKRKGFDLAELLSLQDLGVQVGELARSSTSGLDIEFCHIARPGEAVSERVAFANRPAAHRAGFGHDVLWFAARNRQAHQKNPAALLHREIDRVAVRSPLWRTLAIVDHRADFAALAAIRVHDPNVRVLHGGFAIGQTSAGAPDDKGVSLR